MPRARNGEQRRTKTDDRSTEKSVIFDPNICHELFRFNMLSHKQSLPPFPRIGHPGMPIAPRSRRRGACDMTSWWSREQLRLVTS
jgi:hypothetical protein